MTSVLIDLREPIRATNDLPSLQAALIQQLVGEPFLFARLSYADELVVHFGVPQEYTLPKFGKQAEGSCVLSVRGSAWLLKSGKKPLAAWDGQLPDGFSEPAGERLSADKLQAEALVEPEACVFAAGPFLVAETGSYGLQVLLSDGSRLTVFPTPAERDESGDEGLPELADWELLSPHGALKVGPGQKWAYEPLPERNGSHVSDRHDGDSGSEKGRINRLAEALGTAAPQAPNEPPADATLAWMDDIQIPEYIWHNPPKGLGFPARRVLDVCGAPTAKHIIQWKDLTATIYARAYSGHTDLVGLLDHEQKKMVIFALRILPSLSETPLADLSPLDMVERFSEKFGLTISIGGNSGKIFLEREFPIPRIVLPGRPEGQIIAVENPSNRSFVQNFAFRIDPPSVRIAMAFCTDTAAYWQWLGNH